MKGYFESTTDQSVQERAIDGDFIDPTTLRIVQIENGRVVNVFSAKSIQDLLDSFEELTAVDSCGLKGES
jgi:hypothetical protein